VRVDWCEGQRESAAGERIRGEGGAVIRAEPRPTKARGHAWLSRSRSMAVAASRGRDVVTARVPTTLPSISNTLTPLLVSPLS